MILSVFVLISVSHIHVILLLGHESAVNLAVVTKLHTLRSYKNRTMLQHQQRSPGE
jgi:hypothetical protein